MLVGGWVGCRNMMEVNKNFQREKLSAQTLDSRNTGRYETLPDQPGRGCRRDGS